MLPEPASAEHGKEISASWGQELRRSAAAQTTAGEFWACAWTADVGRRPLEMAGEEDLAVMLLLKFLAHVCQDLSSPEKKKVAQLS